MSARFRAAEPGATTPTPSSCRPSPASTAQPVPDDVLLIGLSAAVPRCAVSLRFDCTIEGIGVDPEWPPLAWEAFDGDSWVECEVDRDTTGGLNRAGEVVLHVPSTHVMSLEHQLRAGWLRARVTTPEEGPTLLQQLASDPRPRCPHHRRDHRSGAGRGDRRRGHRPVRRRPGRALSGGADAGRPLRRARRPRGLRRGGGVAAVDRGLGLCPKPTRRSPLRPGCGGRRSAARSGRAPARRPAPGVRGRAGQRRHPPPAPLPHRRWTPGQRGPDGHPGVPDDDPVRLTRREPVPGDRRSRRRGHRGSQDPRADRHADAGPGRDRRGL